MDQSIKEKILENLTRAEYVLISASKDSGFDGIASALALNLSLTKLGKNTSVKAPSPTVYQARNLYDIDKISKNTVPNNLVVVVDNAVNSVDKVTYFLEGSKLKIVIHPLPGANKLSSEDISFENNSEYPQLLFAIGYNSLEELEKDIVHEHNINPKALIITINNQESIHKFAQAEFINIDAVSISEVTTDVFQQLALPIDEDISYNLYSGILDATRNFSAALAKTSSFEAAQWLIKFGAGKASFAQEIKQANISYKDSFKIENINQEALPEKAIEKAVEDQKLQDDWLKPPRIYKGSKSFDSKN